MPRLGAVPGCLAAGAARTVSAFFRAMGMRACRFEPSCSRYASEAYLSRGFFRASLLSAARLLRCHPFSRGGYDPLPTAREAARSGSE